MLSKIILGAKTARIITTSNKSQITQKFLNEDRNGPYNRIIKLIAFVECSSLDSIPSTTFKAWATKSTFLYLCGGLIFLLGLSFEYYGTAGDGGKVELPITFELYWEIFFNVDPKSDPNGTLPN